MLRRAALLLVLLVLADAAAAAAADAWAKRADAVCRSWAPRQKKAFAGLKVPRTSADAYRFLLIARPLEAGLVRDLRAITLQRSPADDRALAAAARDVRELDAARAAYKSDAKRFLRLFATWANDDTASAAFKAAGAADCA
jgi:hypothetical protein